MAGMARSRPKHLPLAKERIARAVAIFGLLTVEAAAGEGHAAAEGIPQGKHEAVAIEAQAPSGGGLHRQAALGQGDGRRAQLFDVVQEGLVELLLLSLPPGQEALLFSAQGLRLAPLVWILLRQGHPVAARQLPHGLGKGEPQPVLQPADGIGATGADKAMHPVGAGADGEAGVGVRMPGAEGQKFRAALFARPWKGRPLPSESPSRRTTTGPCCRTPGTAWSS